LSRGRCETYIIDVPTVFIAASLLAFVGRRVLVARRPDPFGPSFRAAMLFATVYALGVGFAAWRAPDWMLSYLIPLDDLALPLPLLHAGFLLSCWLAAASAHVLTAVCLQRGWTGRALLVPLGGAITLFSLWGLTLDRYLHIGTWAQFHAGTAVLISDSPLSAGFDVLGLLFAATFGLSVVSLHRQGRRIRAT